MSFRRKKRTGFGKPIVPASPTNLCVTITDADPMSPTFNDGYVPTSRGLVSYMLRLQRVRYSKTIMEPPNRIPRQALVSHASRMIEKFGTDVAARSIRMASMKSPRPFSFKFVGTFTGEIQECLATQQQTDGSP